VPVGTSAIGLHTGRTVAASDESPQIKNHFDKWLSANAAFISVQARGPKFLIPPDWFK
jgi:hypothetical protein